MNHANRSPASREGRALAEKIMQALAGRVGIKINGERVQWNTLKNKTRLHVGDSWIPVRDLPAYLTQHERDELEHLPFWNGNNGYEISLICLVNVGAAIERYQARQQDEFAVLRASIEEWGRCKCSVCRKVN